MAALLQQRSGRALGVACGPEFAAFQAIKSTVRGKEAISPLVSGNNPCSSVLDFDDVSLSHVYPSPNDPVFLSGLVMTISVEQEDQQQAPVAAEKQRSVMR
jgi:hypothetical protein